LDCLG